MPKIHFQSIFRDLSNYGQGRVLARALCNYATEGEASLLKHEVTCERCLKLLMDVAKRSEAA